MFRAAAVILTLLSFCAEAAEQRPPFLTLEDQRRCIEQDANCLKWIYQKEFIRPIVQQVLVQRGFEEKTAYFIARDWDAFRYDLETGAKILPRPPMLMTAADAAGFASRIPQCLTDMKTSTCQFRFAPEYGCNLQHDYGPACRRGFNGVKAKFPAMQASGKTFMSWYDAEYNFYNAIACLFGPNGGDIPVFDAGPAATVTKLKFDAGKEATKVEVATLAQPPAPPAPSVTPAPACKAVVRASHWRANDDFREGQQLPVGLEAPGVDSTNDGLVLQRRGDPLQAYPPDMGIGRPSGPPIAYEDLSDGWLGMELGKIEDLRTPNTALPRVAVLGVTPDGPAAQAGIQSGDYILRIGGRAADDALYLGLHMTEAPAGKPMNVVYQRGGKPATVAITAIGIEEAAGRNDTAALRYLGDFYSIQTSMLGIHDAAKAASYYRKAADLGDVRAMVKLASNYVNSGKEADKAEARKWFELAANAGHIPSMRQLADLYRGGIGLPKDLSRAREWLEKGAAAGDADQMYEIVTIYREEGESKLPEQRKWLERMVATPKGALPKDGGATMNKAIFELAIIKLQGLGGPKDLAEGRKLMETAAASGTVQQAPFLLGLFLLSGEGGPPEPAKAKYWLERGAKGENGDPNAMWALGIMYKDGSGIPQNPVEARKWLKMAADRGQDDARKELGLQQPPPPPQRPIVGPKPITPEMRIPETGAPGPPAQEAKSAGSCNPDCADTILAGAKLGNSSDAADAKACRDRCLATDQCTGWMFVPTVRHCDLVQTVTQSIPWVGTIAGTVSRRQ